MSKRMRQVATMLSVCVSIAAITSPAAARMAVPDTPCQTAAAAAPIARSSPFVREASRRFGIAEDWIKAVIRMESGGHTTSVDGVPITSKKGAMGLMQLMPETWRDMQRQYGLGPDPYDPHDNVLAGTAYLRWLYEKFGFPKMFAAYNAGPATVDAQPASLRGLPQETRAYVRGIARILGTRATGAAATAGEEPQASEIAANAGTMVTLTRPDGEHVPIEASAVTAIRASLPGEFTAGVQTVLSLGQRLQGVRESPEKVVALFKRHGET